MPEKIKSIVQMMIDYSPHMKKIGVELVEEDESRLILKLPFTPSLEIIEGTGVVAHGAITTLVDSALGALTFKQFPEIRKVATLDLRVDFMGSSTPFQDVYTEVTCTKVTREVVFVKGEIYCKKGDPFAQAVASFSHTKIVEMSDDVKAAVEGIQS